MVVGICCYMVFEFVVVVEGDKFCVLGEVGWCEE